MSNENLVIDGSITSNNSQYRLILQEDGNLVLYGPGGAMWSTQTNGHTVSNAAMQGDGNFVLHGSDGGALWSANTLDHPGARLEVQDDGNLVVYSPDNTALWAAGTSQPQIGTPKPQIFQPTLPGGVIIEPLEPYTPVAIKEGDVIKGDVSPNIYLFTNGTKRYIPDMETFLSKWKPELLISCPQAQVTALPNGPDYPSVSQSGIDIGTITSALSGTNIPYKIQQVTLEHILTKRALHSHALNYFNPRSSGQQQVTCYDGNDDNNLWLVKVSYGQAEDLKSGEPITDGDIIRLEHKLTGRNLHSHLGFPSPITSQDEVTCFQENAFGDENDNWRIEITGGGYLNTDNSWQ